MQRILTKEKKLEKLIEYYFYALLKKNIKNR